MKINTWIVIISLLLLSLPLGFYIFSNYSKFNIEFIQPGETTNKYIEYNVNRLRNSGKNGNSYLIFGQNIDESKFTESAKDSIGDPAFLISCENIIILANTKPNISINESIVTVDCER